MSQLRDSISEGNVDSILPQLAVSDESTESNTCKVNEVKEDASQIIISSQKQCSTVHPVVMPEQQQPKDNNPPGLDSVINSLSSQCENVNINADTASASHSPKTSKRKNARKKQEAKKLQLQMPKANSQQTPPQNIPQGSNCQFSPQELCRIQELLARQINHAHANSRYLENLTYHPQYQYIQNPQLNGKFQYNQPSSSHTTASVPNSPFCVPFQQPGSLSFPNSPTVAAVNSPRYIQNMLQHPLLSQSLATVPQKEVKKTNKTNKPKTNSQEKQNGQLVEENDSQRRRRRIKKKSESNKNDHSFEPYMSAEEVELGLKNNSLLEGVLRINPKQYQHAYVSSSDRSEQDILLDGVKNRNRALEGDVVVVQYLESTEVPGEIKEDDMQKRGKVVFIKEIVHPRTTIGTLKLMPDKNRQKALFIPRDFRIPRLNIPSISWPDNFYEDSKNYENTLFLAKILHWSDVRFALGKIVCNIGQSGDMQTETKAILVQNELDITPFGPEVKHLYPDLDYTIPEEEIKLREDCRSLCLFSIDPFNCRDIDDALSCQKLENGNYEIGVHISDVAHYLKENTILDEKVAEKATTIYLVERAYHMLPDDLCMLCSLFPGVDKLAFSVFWEITEDARVLNHRFAKTIIHSCSQLAYEHAQSVLDDDENAESKFPETFNGYTFKDVFNAIKVLGKISSIFRKDRFNGGALSINQPKISFKLNPSNGMPESFWIYELKPSHQLIEEFMLLANMTVAKRIYDDHPKLAFLRCHPPPSGYMLNSLVKSLKPLGVDLEISSAGDLQRSLLAYFGSDCIDAGRALVLNMLCAKAMTRAKYFCSGGSEEDYNHYALNVPLYTHFTSPIRRYADIMVHRLLAASLNYRDVPKWREEQVSAVAAQCNKQKYNAKRAGEMSTELYALKYIELHSPILYEAVVVEVREKYIDVIIIAMGLNRRIFFNSDFPGEYRCTKSGKNSKLNKMEVIWKATDNSPVVTQVLEVFSMLNVEMYHDDGMIKVETRLVRP